MTVAKFLKSFTHKTAAKASQHRNYATASPYVFILFIYYKIVHEVHDRQTYSKNNESSKSSTKHKH